MPEGARAPGRATRKPSQWVPCLFVISGGDLPFQPLAHENPTARPWLLYSTYSREARPELDERRRCRWYPGFCVGFDVAVAARLVLEKQGTPGLRRSARLRQHASTWVMMTTNPTMVVVAAQSSSPTYESPRPCSQQAPPP